MNDPQKQKYKFRLKKSRHSDQLGSCELCHEPGDLYIWTRREYYQTSIGTEGYRERELKFGHRDCLQKHQQKFV